MREAELLSIANMFADVVFDESGWIPALARFADATGSARGQIIGFGGPVAIPFNHITEFTEGGLEEFAAIGGGDPGINWRVAAGFGGGVLEVLSERDYLAVKPLLAHNVYEEFVHRYDLPFGCQTNLFMEEGSLVGLAMLRSARDGPTTARDRAVFARIAPDVRRAVRLSQMLEQQGAQLVAGTLETMALAAVVCDAFGSVRAMTPRAETCLDGRLPVRLGGGRLQGRTAEDAAAIASALAMATGSEPGAGVSSTILVGAGDRVVVLSFLALPKRDYSFGFAPRAVMVVRQGAGAAGIAPSLMGSLYGLTASETDIVRSFLAGHSRDRIAAERGVSLSTVQSQLKIVFRKVGVRREVELAIKLAAFAADDAA